MMTQSPCYDKRTRTDCPKRCVGCKSSCAAWAAWLIVHEQEREKTRKAKQNEADDFLIGQTDRVKLARHRDYMRGYKRR